MSVLEILASKTENGTEYGDSMIFQYFFEILTFSTTIWFHTKCFIPNVCSEIFISENLRQTLYFENTTFRFVKLSAVGFLRPKSNFQHLNRNILEILSSKTEIGLSYIRCMTRRARVGGHNVIQKSAGTENVIGQCQYDFFD